MDTRMRKVKKNKLESLFFVTAMLLMIFLPSLKTNGAESVVIRSINVKFTSEFGDQEILMPEITTTTSGVEVKDMEWRHDISKWKAGKNERVSVILTSNEKVFADSYNRSECKITGAKFVSAKAVDNYTLKVQLNYDPVVNLGNTEEAGWSDSTKTKAVWKKVEFATGYEVVLYANDKRKKSVKVKTNTVDLSEYMKQDAEYYYEVRAIGYTSTDRKYMKRGDYITSDDTVMEYDGDTSGKWKGNTYIQEDGGVPRNCWKQILNDWYYFDGNGIRRVGWIKSGQRWYYLSQTDGKLMTGWQMINNKWYYLNPAGGEMMNGWIQPKPSVWYYMYSDGSMASNTTINGYQVDASGEYVSNS